MSEAEVEEALVAQGYALFYSEEFKSLRPSIGRNSWFHFHRNLRRSLKHLEWRSEETDLMVLKLGSLCTSFKHLSRH